MNGFDLFLNFAQNILIKKHFQTQVEFVQKYINTYLIHTTANF